MNEINKKEELIKELRRLADKTHSLELEIFHLARKLEREDEDK